MLTSTSRVAIKFGDGIERELAVAPGQSVLEAGRAAGLPLLFQCGLGSCGTCLARLEAGSADHRPGTMGALLPSERQQGCRLLCITEPAGDCRFSVGYDSVVGAARPLEAKCFVNAVERLADDVARLELELAEDCWMDFHPGQFIQVTVPGSGVRRSYSIASMVDDLPRIELMIRLLPGGLMSDWLVNRAAIDDVLEIRGPYGQFFLKEKVRATHLMIAGGTGLAPMLSMLDAIRVAPGRKPRVLLSFGCRSTEALFALDRLEQRELWMPTLEARISVDHGEAPEGMWRGDPVSAIGEEDALGADSVAYLCGPPAMVEAARAHLERLGLSAANIFAEQFVASK